MGAESEDGNSFYCNQMEDTMAELEELRELNTKRLDELEKKTGEHKEALKELERLKMDVSYNYLCIFYCTVIEFLAWNNLMYHFYNHQIYYSIKIFNLCV